LVLVGPTDSDTKPTLALVSDGSWLEQERITVYCVSSLTYYSSIMIINNNNEAIIIRKNEYSSTKEEYSVLWVAMEKWIKQKGNPKNVMRHASLLLTFI
jgi:hypothetical protein